MSDPMKDFQAIPAEPEPDDSVFARWFTYLFGSAFIGAIFAGIVFFQQSGVGDRRLARRNLQDVEASNKRVLALTKTAAGIGVALGLFLSLRYEFVSRKRG